MVCVNMCLIACVCVCYMRVCICVYVFAFVYVHILSACGGGVLYISGVRVVCGV